jgi:hypothetical protein
MLQRAHLVNLERVALWRDEMQVRVPAGGNKLARTALPAWHGLACAVESLGQRAGECGLANVLQARDEISVGGAPAFDGVQQESHCPVVADHRPG